MSPYKFLYVLRCGDALKIGIATNFDARLSKLQTGNPVSLKLERLWKGEGFTADRYEGALHRAFGRMWVSGEWYRCTPAEIDAAVERLSKDPRAGQLTLVRANR